MTHRLATLTAAPAVILACTAILAACSSSNSNNTASPASSSITITGMRGTATVPAADNPLTLTQLPNPCTVPSAVLTPFDVHVQPDNAAHQINDGTYTKSCGYTHLASPSYGFDVMVSRRSYQEMLTSPDVTVLSKLNVDGTELVHYRDPSSSDDPAEGDAYFWGAPFGTIWAIGQSVDRGINPDAPDIRPMTQQWAIAVFHSFPPKQ